MAKKLIILESPGKIKYVKKYLSEHYGPNEWQVMASVGHIAYLTTEGDTKIGLEDFDNFKPIYKVDPSKKEVVSQLRSAVKNASKVYLATDPDREGEGIAAHLDKFLNLKGDFVRVKYNSVTPEEVVHSIENPSEFDVPLYDAQDSRRVVDRIFGYLLSPVMQGLSNTFKSVGRVQTPTLRLLVELEEKIINFTPNPYLNFWFVENSTNEKFKLSSFKGKEIGLLSRKSLKETTSMFTFAKNLLQKEKVEVITASSKVVAVNPPKLFKKSTLLSVVGQALKISSKEIDDSIQKLYEAGKITYPRSDSDALDDQTIDKLRSQLGDKAGDHKVTFGKVKETDQAAHTAIVPTSFDPDLSGFSPLQISIYKMIEDRTKKFLGLKAFNDVLSVELKLGDFILSSKFAVLKTQGWRDSGDTKKLIKTFPTFKKGSIVTGKFDSKQDKTTPPTRLDEGGLIGLMDKHAIGRPATFAGIINNLKSKGYVKLVKLRLIPTEVGINLINVCKDMMPKLIDLKFTSVMEKSLDMVATQKITRKQYLTEMYKNIRNVESTIKSSDGWIKATKESFAECPICKNPQAKKMNGKSGPWIACPNYKDPKMHPPQEYITCPDCGNKKARTGKWPDGTEKVVCSKWATHKKGKTPPRKQTSKKKVVSYE